MGLAAPYGRGAGARGFVARIGLTAPFAVFSLAIVDFAVLAGAAATTAIGAFPRAARDLVPGFFG